MLSFFLIKQDANVRLSFEFRIKTDLVGLLQNVTQMKKRQCIHSIFVPFFIQNNINAI